MASIKSIKLASFDGGGVQGLSQLEIIGRIMRLLNWDKSSHEQILPCEYFDLMGGSGTGGLIVILLTKLRMSADEAFEEFNTIIEEAYSQDKHMNPRERTRILRQNMEGILRRKGLPLNTLLVDEPTIQGCVGFAVASLRANVNTLCLRTYPVRSEPSPVITVIDAVLASCATQPNFEPVSSGIGFRKREYVAATAAPNPVQEVIAEAHLYFGGDITVASLLSLGIGNPGIISLPLADGEVALMHECEKRAQESERRIGSTGIYFRFSVDQGMQGDHLAQIHDPGWILTQTEDYLRRHETREKIDSFAQNVGPQTQAVTLKQLYQVGNSKITNEIASSVNKSLGILISNQDDAVIARLKPTDVEYGSHVTGCMEGTRRDILTEIDSWATDLDASNILWVNGHPGAGKSAIATTVVERFESSGRICSSFFFRRERASVMTPHALWRTVAYNLARRYTAIRQHLVCVLNENEDLPNISHIDTLFRGLIREPLMANEEMAVDKFPIIVVDALDECGGLNGRHSDYRKGLMRTLESWSNLPRKFKLLIFSRKESDIEILFSRTSHKSLEILTGEKVTSQSSEDIRTFLKCELQKIALQYRSLPHNWPGDEVVEELNTRAGGLFIWPKTVVKQLEHGEPQDTLEKILAGEAGGMKSLYAWILNAAFPDPSKRTIQHFRAVLGTVIFSKTPIDAASLACLFSFEGSVIDHICNGLKSVIDCEDTIQILHQSFADFLVDPGECLPDFRIERKREGRNITLACLNVMKTHLRFNICDLKTSYVRNDDVPGLATRVKSRISRCLRYASLSWASHIAEITFDSELLEGIQYFTQNQFLFWLEVLSLIKRVNVGSKMLQTLIDWIRRSGQDDSFVTDMQRFIVNFASVISQSVPHIYLSALPFAPRALDVSKQYLEGYPRTFNVRSGNKNSWPVMQNILTGHQGRVCSVAVSPDGRLIVSSSSDGTIRIWDAETTETIVGPLKEHARTVLSVSFSPDSRHIVSGSTDGTIRIWDVEIGKMVVASLIGYANSVLSVSFSPDGRSILSISQDGTIRVWNVQKETRKILISNLELDYSVRACWCYPSVSYSPNGRKIIASPGNGTVQIWDAKTGQPAMNPLRGHTHVVGSTSFSPDGRRIVSGSWDTTIRIWNAETGDTLTGPLTGHSNAVISVSFSPDGKRIVSGSRDRTIRVWDAETGDALTRPMRGHTHNVNSVSFFPDARRVVSCADDWTIRLWDIETEETAIGPLDEPIDTIRSISFSPDGRLIASGSGDETIRVWAIKTGKLLLGPLKGHNGPVYSISFSTDGRHIVSGGRDRIIRVWDVESGKLAIDPLEGHTDVINCVLFSSDGKLIASGSEDTTIRIWDAETGKMVVDPLGRQGHYVLSISFSPDGRRIVSGSSDKTIRVWDTKTGNLALCSLHGHRGAVTSVSFSPDGRIIASGSHDYEVRVWDAETGQPLLGPLKGHKSVVTSISFSPDCRRLVSGSWDRTVRLWDVETGDAVLGLLEGHTNWVTCVAFSPDGKLVASGSEDRTIQVWNVETVETPITLSARQSNKVPSAPPTSDSGKIISDSEGKEIRLWDAQTGKLKQILPRIHNDVVTCVSFSPNGKHFVSSSWDNTILLWDIETVGDLIGPLEGHEGTVNAVSFSSDGKRIVSGSWDQTVRVWDMGTRKELRGPFIGHFKSVSSVSFSPDDRRIVSGSWDKTIRLWDVDTGKTLIGPLNGHEGNITSVSFSPDGRSVVSGSWDNTIRVWDTQTGEILIGPMKGHDHVITSVSFSPNGKIIVSGSWDKTIRIWCAETGETLLQPLQGHLDWVESVSFSPDSRRIVSGSRDQSILIWDVETGKNLLGPLEGHIGSVTSVSFSPDGMRIMSCSGDKVVGLWDNVMNDTDIYSENWIYSSGDEQKSTVREIEERTPAYNVPASDFGPRNVPDKLSLFGDRPQTEDGWILGPNSELLLWILPDIRRTLCSSRHTLVIGKYRPMLDLTNFVHGEAWTQCTTQVHSTAPEPTPIPTSALASGSSSVSTEEVSLSRLQVTPTNLPADEYPSKVRGKRKRGVITHEDDSNDEIGPPKKQFDTGNIRGRGEGMHNASNA